MNWQIRSFQTEGHFGDIKENDGFRCFNYLTAEKVYNEFMLYVIGRNINNIIVFFMIKSKNLREKPKKRMLSKM